MSKQENRENTTGEPENGQLPDEAVLEAAEPNASAVSDGGEAEEQDETPEETIARLQSELTDAQEQAASHLDKMQRTVAEYENAGKRRERQNEERIKRATESMMRQLLPVIDAVLKGKHQGMRPQHGLDRFDGRRIVVHLHGKKHQFLGACLRRVLHRVAGDGKVAVVGAFDPESIGLDGLQVGSSGHKGYVVSSPGQKTAEVASHAAGSHYCDFHWCIPLTGESFEQVRRTLQFDLLLDGVAVFLAKVPLHHLAHDVAGKLIDEDYGTGPLEAGQVLRAMDNKG